MMEHQYFYLQNENEHPNYRPLIHWHQFFWTKRNPTMQLWESTQREKNYILWTRESCSKSRILQSKSKKGPIEWWSAFLNIFNEIFRQILRTFLKYSVHTLMCFNIGHSRHIFLIIFCLFTHNNVHSISYDRIWTHVIMEYLSLPVFLLAPLRELNVNMWYKYYKFIELIYKMTEH